MARRRSLWDRLPWMGLCCLGLFALGRISLYAWNAPKREEVAPKVPLSMAGRSYLGHRAIRSGFTSEAANAIHHLVDAFESERVDLFADLVDLDYEFDYHRLLFDLERNFDQHGEIDVQIDLVGVEPLAAGFVAEVRWTKSYRVEQTGHRIQEEGDSRLFFGGESPPRLKSIRGHMLF